MNSTVMSTGVPIAATTGERRKGKWTYEEEAYATRLIRDFKAGILPLRDGASLRAYLAEKLNCEPMRITKKFARTDCIGKVTFRPASLTVFPPELRAIAAREAEELRGRFLLREAQGANWANAGMAGAAGVMSPMSLGSTAHNFAVNMGNQATFPLAPPKGMPSTPGSLYPPAGNMPTAGFASSPGGMVSNANAAAAAAAAAVQLHPNTSSPLCSPNAGAQGNTSGMAAHEISSAVGLASPANAAVGREAVGNAITTIAGSDRVDLKSKSEEDNEAGSILLSFIAKAWSNSPKASHIAASAAAAAANLQKPVRTAFVPTAGGTTASVAQRKTPLAKAESVAKGKRALEVDAVAADAEAAQRVATSTESSGTDAKLGQNSFKRPKTEANVPQALASTTAPAASDSPVSVHLVSKANTAKLASASTAAPSVADDISARLADAQQSQSPGVVDSTEASPASDDADSTQSEPVVSEKRQTRRARAAAAAANAALTLSA